MVLVVDDDRDLVDLLAYLVDHAGLSPMRAYEPAAALELFDTHSGSLALAIIDLNLHPGDGFELIAELRRRSPTLPMIVLTGRNNEDDKVRALELGADDYILKPFGHRELIARIRAQMRRAANGSNGGAFSAVLEVGPLRLDANDRSLQFDDQTLHLTGTEFRLLQYLIRNVNSVVPTAALARHIWGYDDAPARDAVRVTVHRLRRKLGDDSANPRFIETVPGIGLKLHRD